MNFYLTSIENIQKLTGSKVETGSYEFQMLIVGTDANQRLITKIILKTRIADNVLTSDVDSVEKVDIKDSFIFKSAGVSGITEDILNNPEKYKFYPAIANYANHWKKDKGVNLSSAEIRDIAEAILDITSNLSMPLKGKTFYPVGGPHQLAILENSKFKTIFPIFRPSPPPPLLYNLFTKGSFGGNIGFTSIPAAIAFDPNSTIMMFIATEFRNGGIKIDHQYFFGDTFENCTILADSNVFHFDKSNSVKGCDLILGVNVDLTSQKIVFLKSNFKWKKIREGLTIRK